MRSSESVAHWHEYGIGVGGRVADAVIRVATGFAGGLLVSAGLLAVANLLHPVGLLPDSAEPILDLVTEASLMLLVALGYCCWLVWVLAAAVRRVSTSRALARAARAGASPLAVPHPQQIEWATEARVGGLLALAIGHIVLALIGSALLLAGVPWWIGAVCAACVVLMVALIVVVRGYLRPEAESRLRQVSTHWREAEPAAWARAQGRPRRARSVPDQRPLAQRAGAAVSSALLPLAALLALATVLLGLVYVAVYYPDAYIRSDDLSGPRADRGAGVDHATRIGMWVAAGCLALSLVVFLVALAIDILRSIAETGALRRTLADPTARRPAHRLLEMQTGEPSTLTFLAGMTSAVALTFGWTAVLLGGLHYVTHPPSPAYPRGFDSVTWHGYTEFAGAVPFPQFLTAGEVVLWGSVALLAASVAGTARARAHSRELRNSLMRRWPVRPVSHPDSDRESDKRERESSPARYGPVLDGYE